MDQDMKNRPKSNIHQNMRYEIKTTAIIELVNGIRYVQGIGIAHQLSISRHTAIHGQSCRITPPARERNSIATGTENCET